MIALWVRAMGTAGEWNENVYSWTGERKLGGD